MQDLTLDVVASEAHLFRIEPAEMIRYVRVLAQPGDMIFFGQNPPAGAIIDYYLREAAADDVSLAVLDAAGKEIRKLEPSKRRGINRVVWDLRHPRWPDPVAEQPDEEEREAPRGPSGPLVVPGQYTVRLTVAGRSYEQKVDVNEDPRIDVDPAERRAWTGTLLQLGEMYASVNGWVKTVVDVQGKVEKVKSPPERIAQEAGELRKLLLELRRRVRSLYGDIGEWTGPPTDEQQAQMNYFSNAMRELEPRVRALSTAQLPGGM